MEAREFLPSIMGNFPSFDDNLKRNRQIMPFFI